MSKIDLLQITFLGTGTSQGIPIIGSDHPVCHSENPKDKRLRVSVLIEYKSLNILIDCGPDFRQQMLANEVKHLDAILYTHEHNDHMAGLDDIRPFFFKQGNIPIFAHKRVITALSKRFDYIFVTENKYPGAPGVQVNELTNTAFKFNEIEILPIDFHHNSLQVFGFRIENFAYLTDVKSIEDSEVEKLYNLDTLVVSALRIEPHHSHFSLNEALQFIQRVNPKKAYLTHISHMMGFHDEVQAILPENVYLAYDNLKIKVPYAQ